MRGWKPAPPAVVLLLTSVVLAGCSAPAGTDAPSADVTWASSYTVTTVPLEPFDLQGTNVVAYDGELVGLYVENEDDMAIQHVRSDGVWYTTVNGRGWTLYATQEELDVSNRAHRLQTWDPRGLVEGATSVDRDGAALTARTAVTSNGRTETVVLRAILDGDRVASATVDTPFDAESPYTIEAGGRLPFSLEVPSDVLDAASVRAGDGAARTEHVRVIQWIQSYRQQTGSLPQTVDAQTLSVQRLGQDWPNNVFTEEPLRHADDSGHFLWHYCGPQDGTYVGLGWDAAPVGESFGRGCQG